MQIVFLDTVFRKLQRWAPVELSPQAEQRLKKLQRFEWLRFDKGLSGGQAAAVLEVGRATLYRWRLRMKLSGPRGLEPGHRRPHRVRKPGWSPKLVERVMALRSEFPAWGKKKLTVILRREGRAVSESTVGRILGHLIEHGRLQRVAALRQRHRRARQMRRRYAQRLPRNAARPTLPGERVQLDTVHVSLAPGAQVKHFSAACPVSRWGTADVFRSAVSSNAAIFLDRLIKESPFPVLSLQVDGGSEFKDAFETACQKRNLPLYVLPPRSPKINATVERRQESWRGEFYEAYLLPEDLPALRPAVQQHQLLYNTYRPHQALLGLTPAEFLLAHHPTLLHTDAGRLLSRTTPLESPTPSLTAYAAHATPTGCPPSHMY